MKKSEFMELLTKRLSKENVDLIKKDLETTVKTIFDSIGDVIKKEDSILIPGFGTFKQGKRAARMARNPQTGEEIRIKAKKVPQFKAAMALKEKIN